MPLTPLATLRTGCAGRLAVLRRQWVVAEAGCAQLRDGFDEAAAYRTLPAGLGLAAGFDAAGEHVLVDLWRIPLGAGEPEPVPQTALAAGPGGGYRPCALAWSPDGAELLAVAVAAAGGWRVAAVDPATGGLRALVDGSGDGGPDRIACTAEVVLTAGGAGVELHDRALQPLGPVPGTAGVQALAAAGPTAAAVTAEGELIVIDLPSGRVAASVPAHAGRATAVAVAPSGDRVATGSEDGEVRAFGTDGEPLARTGVIARVDGIAIGDDGLVLVAFAGAGERRVSALWLDA